MDPKSNSVSRIEGVLAMETMGMDDIDIELEVEIGITDAKGSMFKGSFSI